MLAGTCLQWWDGEEKAKQGTAPRNWVLLTFQSSVRPLDDKVVDSLGYPSDHYGNNVGSDGVRGGSSGSGGGEAAAAAATDSAGMRHGIEISVQRGKRLVVCASSEKERQEWLAALCGAVPTVGDAGVALFLRALGGSKDASVPGSESTVESTLEAAARSGAGAVVGTEPAVAVAAAAGLAPRAGGSTQESLDILELRGTLRWTPIVGEHLRASIVVDKVNRRGAWQRRELVITETAVYIIGIGNKRGCKR